MAKCKTQCRLILLYFYSLSEMKEKNILWCILVGSTIQIKKGPSLCCNTTLVYDKLINKKVLKGNSDTFCNVSDFSCSNELLLGDVLLVF